MVEKDEEKRLAELQVCWIGVWRQAKVAGALSCGLCEVKILIQAHSAWDDVPLPGKELKTKLQCTSPGLWFVEQCG